MYNVVDVLYYGTNANRAIQYACTCHCALC